MTDSDVPDGVAFEDLPVRFEVSGFECLVRVHGTEKGPSHFCGYVFLPDDLDGREVAPLLEAPGGLTFVNQDRVGFDTAHARMLNVDDAGDPLAGGGNAIEARHEDESTVRYDAQAAVEATAELARSLARGTNLSGEGDR